MSQPEAPSLPPGTAVPPGTSWSVWSSPAWAKVRWCWSLIADTLSIAGFVITVVSLVRVTLIRDSVGVLAAATFAVAYPVDNGEVAITEIVVARTPYPHKRHYVVVTPIENSVDYIQDDPVTVTPGGAVTGRARFGEASVGQDQRFVVRILATDAPLRPGALTAVPEDAMLSSPVVVTRRK